VIIVTRSGAVVIFVHT